MKGLVFNIQRYSIQDGPGIRTTLFLKGCPLKCQWCSNPESQNPYAEILLRESRCEGCGSCVQTCHRGAVTLEKGVARLNRISCDLCLDCLAGCPADALEVTGTYMSVEQALEECEKDDLFYQNSGGGVTLSGGEPLAQPEFALHFLKACKDRSFHTALDTCGHADWECLAKLLPYTDLVLFDIKHLDPASHHLGTGAGNDLILENLKRIQRARQNSLWLRMPIIPGYNDSDEHARRVALAISDMAVEKISLLSYHTWGRAKYLCLGRDYPLDGTGSADKKRLERIKRIITDTTGRPITIDY